MVQNLNVLFNFIVHVIYRFEIESIYTHKKIGPEKFFGFHVSTELEETLK